MLSIEIDLPYFRSAGRSAGSGRNTPNLRLKAA
jgi:hypothetical protein